MGEKEQPRAEAPAVVVHGLGEVRVTCKGVREQYGVMEGLCEGWRENRKDTEMAWQDIHTTPDLPELLGRQCLRRRGLREVLSMFPRAMPRGRVKCFDSTVSPQLPPTTPATGTCGLSKNGVRVMQKKVQVRCCFPPTNGLP